jgi:hypothetical protein
LDVAPKGFQNKVRVKQSFGDVDKLFIRPGQWVMPGCAVIDQAGFSLRVKITEGEVSEKLYDFRRHDVVLPWLPVAVRFLDILCGGEDTLWSRARFPAPRGCVFVTIVHPFSLEKIPFNSWPAWRQMPAGTWR